MTGTFLLRENGLELPLLPSSRETISRLLGVSTMTANTILGKCAGSWDETVFSCAPHIISQSSEQALSVEIITKQFQTLSQQVLEQAEQDIASGIPTDIPYDKPLPKCPVRKKIVENMPSIFASRMSCAMLSKPSLAYLVADKMDFLKDPRNLGRTITQKAITDILGTDEQSLSNMVFGVGQTTKPLITENPSLIEIAEQVAFMLAPERKDRIETDRDIQAICRTPIPETDIEAIRKHSSVRTPEAAYAAIISMTWNPKIHHNRSCELEILLQRFSPAPYPIVRMAEKIRSDAKNLSPS